MIQDTLYSHTEACVYGRLPRIKINTRQSMYTAVYADTKHSTVRE